MSVHLTKIRGFLSGLAAITMACSVAVAGVPGYTFAMPAEKASDSDARRASGSDASAAAESGEARRGGETKSAEGTDSGKSGSGRASASDADQDYSDVISGVNIDGLLEAEQTGPREVQADGRISIPVSWSLDEEEEEADRIMPGDYVSVLIEGLSAEVSISEEDGAFAKIVSDSAEDSGDTSCQLLLSGRGISAASGSLTLLLDPLDETDAAEMEGSDAASAAVYFAGQELHWGEDPVLSAGKKRSYRAESPDRNVIVTALLEKPEAVPDDAELTVTPVTADSGYSYDAYLEALNAAAGDGESYDQNNTLFLDIAFLAEEVDENGDKTGKRVEVQPSEGTVDLQVQFTESQLNALGASNAEEVSVTHLPLKEEVRNAVDSTAEASEISASDIETAEVESAVSALGSRETVEFTAESFSVFVFKDSSGQKNTWNNGPDEGTKFGYEDVLEMLREKDPETTGFAIYSNQLKQSLHLEGNIKTGKLIIEQDHPQNLN